MRILFFLLMLPALTHAQQIIKWGKYQDFEIELKEVSYEQEAGAVILTQVAPR